MERSLFEVLLRTKALTIADADTPFWYTSGELGPYYINTHFVCGGKEKSLELLDLITQEADAPKTLPTKVLSRLEALYESYEDYRLVIDAVCEKIKNDLPFDSIAGISGGQRRDWFFAPIVAKLLKRPCLYLYNDGHAIDEHGDRVDSLHGDVFVNVCDLLRVGSSYTSKWIPSIAALNGTLRYSVAVVDRCEGGRENILAAGVEQSLCLFTLDKEFFELAREQKLISQAQYTLLIDYLQDPRAAMRAFLLAHPQFLQDALSSSNEKVRQRAHSLVENNYYQLDLNT